MYRKERSNGTSFPDVNDKTPKATDRLIHVTQHFSTLIEDDIFNGSKPVHGLPLLYTMMQVVFV